MKLNQYILRLSLVSEYQAVQALVPGEPMQLGFIRNMLVPGKLAGNNHQPGDLPYPRIEPRSPACG